MALAQHSPKKSAQELEARNGKAVEDTLLEHDGDEGYTCGECGVIFFNDDEFYFVRSGSDAIICKSCSRLKRRIATLRQSHKLPLETFGDMDKVERQAFMKANAEAFGTNLTKALSEAVRVRNVKKVESSWKETGTPMLEEDAKKLPKYANDDEKWQNLLRNAHRFTCDVDGSKYIVVPSYTYEKNVSNTDEQEKSRELSVEDKVKGPKGKAAAKKGKAPKKLTMGMLKKVDGAIKALGGCIMQVQRAVCICSTEEAKPFVPEHIVKVARNTIATMNDKLSVLKEQKEQQDKLALVVSLKQYADICGKGSELLNTIEGQWSSRRHPEYFSALKF